MSKLKLINDIIYFIIWYIYRKFFYKKPKININDDYKLDTNFLTPDEKHELRKEALKLEGLPYKFGAEVRPGDKPHALDCSESNEYIYRKIGYEIPDGSWNQLRESVYETPIQTGFLGFKIKNGKVYHTFMYLGGGLVLEAKGKKWGVIITTRKKVESSKYFYGWRKPILKRRGK